MRLYKRRVQLVSSDKTHNIACKWNESEQKDEQCKQPVPHECMYPEA